MAHTEDPDDRTTFLQGLRHARRFQDRPVPPAIVDALLAAGRGGTATGDQPWRFLVIDDLETRRALSRIGAFTSILEHTAVAIVIVTTAGAVPSRASAEARAGDRIMLAASQHGLGGGTGWFGTEEAQERARDILGLPPGQSVWGAVGVGYVDEAPVAGESALERARKTLDQLAAKGPSPAAPPDD